MVLGNGGSMFCLSKYTYLGVDFTSTSTGAWDVHIKNVLDNGRRKVNQLHSVIGILVSVLAGCCCWRWLENAGRS